MLNTGFTKLNARLNLTQKALNDRFTFNLNLSATHRESQLGFEEAFRYATIYNPTAPVKSDDAAYDIYDGYFNQVLFDYYNPVQILEQNVHEGTSDRLNIAVKGAYEIIDGLILDAFYSIQSVSILEGEYYDKNSYWWGMNTNGYATRRQEDRYNQLFETSASLYGVFSSSVYLNAFGGYSYQEFINEGFGATGGDFITDAFTYNNLNAALDFNNGLGNIWSWKNSNKLIAFFGRVNVNVSDTWFLTASARYEGSSRFGVENQWGLFPAIGGGVELAKFINASSIDNLKFRVNYGVTGNQPGDSYLSLLRLGPSGSFFYKGEFVPGYAPVSNANEDLAWEKKSEIDIGFDFSLFESKLFGSFDFYTRTSTDILFEYAVPVPPNLYTHAWLNLGEIKSSGVELAITFNAVEKTDFSYSLTFTPSYNIKNILVSLSGTYQGEELIYGVQTMSNMGSPGQNEVPLVIVEEGEPIGQLYSLVYEGINESGDLIHKDINGDGTIDPDDRQVVGNGLPDFLFGFGNNFTYKNWDLNIFFRGVFGHDLINTYRAFYEVPNMIGSYNLPATAKDRKSPGGTFLNNSSGVFSDYHVENASFVSLDNLNLGYNFNLPESSGFRKIRVYLSGNNLFYITGYKGVDPNPRFVDSGYQGTHNSPLVPGVDRRDTWARTRSISFGVNIGF
jgi:iron complex outermembrane receptor protein